MGQPKEVHITPRVAQDTQYNSNSREVLTGSTGQNRDFALPVTHRNDNRRKSVAVARKSMGNSKELSSKGTKDFSMPGSRRRRSRIRSTMVPRGNVDLKATE